MRTPPGPPTRCDTAAANENRQSSQQHYTLEPQTCQVFIAHLDGKGDAGGRRHRAPHGDGGADRLPVVVRGAGEPRASPRACPMKQPVSWFPPVPPEAKRDRQARTLYTPNGPLSATFVGLPSHQCAGSQPFAVTSRGSPWPCPRPSAFTAGEPVAGRCRGARPAPAPLRERCSQIRSG
mgnify:CR=1 FL=1